MRTSLVLAVLLLALAPAANAADVPPECTVPADLEVADGGEIVLDFEVLCGEPVALTVIQGPLLGEITLEDANVTYAVDAGFAAFDSFVVEATNAGMESTLVFVNINVVAPADNRAPTCLTPPELTTLRDTPIVLDSDFDPAPLCTDPDGHELSYIVVEFPRHGTLEPFPAITYRPAPGYVGTDSIRFGASDPYNVASNIVTLSLRITGPPPPTGSPPPAGSPPPPVLSPPPDVAAPELVLGRAGRQALRAVRRRGLKLRLTSSEPGTVAIEVRVSRATARALGIRRVIGRATRALQAGESTVTVKLARKARRRLARVRRIRLRVAATAVDAAGNRSQEVRMLTIRR